MEQSALSACSQMVESGEKWLMQWIVVLPLTQTWSAGEMSREQSHEVQSEEMQSPAPAGTPGSIMCWWTLCWKPCCREGTGDPCREAADHVPVKCDCGIGGQGCIRRRLPSRQGRESFTSALLRHIWVLGTVLWSPAQAHWFKCSVGPERPVARTGWEVGLVSLEETSVCINSWWKGVKKREPDPSW